MISNRKTFPASQTQDNLHASLESKVEKMQIKIADLEKKIINLQANNNLVATKREPNVQKAKQSQHRTNLFNSGRRYGRTHNILLPQQFFSLLENVFDLNPDDLAIHYADGYTDFYIKTIATEKTSGLNALQFLESVFGPATDKKFNLMMPHVQAFPAKIFSPTTEKLLNAVKQLKEMRNQSNVSIESEYSQSTSRNKIG